MEEEVVDGANEEVQDGLCSIRFLYLDNICRSINLHLCR